AVRAGISEVVLPRENAADLDELPDAVRERIRVHLVDRLDEVLEIALSGGVFRNLVWTG
ncbi:MAG: hypothetical protein KDC38_17380, partial [Planctomycetes bacterium]|nr:hypothetical protein [Planctomycetota bacterium]